MGSEPSAHALGYILTLLRSFFGFGFAWIFNCSAVHPAGENMLRPKQLQAKKLDSG